MVNDNAHNVNDPLHRPGRAGSWWPAAGGVAVIAAIGLGCGAPDPAPPGAADGSAVDTAPGAGAPRADAAGVAAEITPEGIGAARVGMTVAEIRASLGAGLRLSDDDDPFMVDLNGMPVLSGDDALYYLVFPSAEVSDDDAVPLLAVTDHPSVRTSEGIGPGSTLAEAAAVYGQPTLRFNPDDEMREYATFPGYTHPTVHFRVAPGEITFLAGRYGQDSHSGETGEFDGDARIMMVLVELRRY